MAKKRTNTAQMKTAVAIAASAAATLRNSGEEMEKVARAAFAVLGDTHLTRKLKGHAGALELHARSIERRLKEI